MNGKYQQSIDYAIKYIHMIRRCCVSTNITVKHFYEIEKQIKSEYCFNNKIHSINCEVVPSGRITIRKYFTEGTFKSIKNILLANRNSNIIENNYSIDIDYDTYIIIRNIIGTDND